MTTGVVGRGQEYLSPSQSMEPSMNCLRLPKPPVHRFSMVARLTSYSTMVSLNCVQKNNESTLSSR